MEISELSHLEQEEWRSFVERSARNGVAQEEAERIAAEALEAGVRLLPAPDSVSAPGGTVIELTPDSMRAATAVREIGQWFEGRHPGTWIGGWESGKWSGWLGEEECLAKASAKLRAAVATLDAAGARRAALTAERVALLRKAVQVAGQ